MAFLKRRWPYLLLSLVSFLFSFLILEAGYRVYRFNKLMNDYAPYPYLSVEGSLYNFDVMMGYRYVPEMTHRLTWVTADGEIAGEHEFSVNNAGIIAHEPVSRTAPVGEYRILLLGDSYTASMTNPTPWAEFLQAQLNEDATLKESLGADYIHVVNFAQDGSGIIQFEYIMEHAAIFAPDLVLANFITDDINRRFMWRETQPWQEVGYRITLQCYSLPVEESNPDCFYARTLEIAPEHMLDAESRQGMTQSIYEDRVNGLPWRSAHSELLALLGIGRRRLTLGTDTNIIDVGYFSDLEGLQRSTASLQKLAAEHPLIAVHLPIYEEIEAGEISGRVAELEAGNPNIPFYSVFDHLPASETNEAWFNLPHDEHLSEAGAEVYATAVYEILKAYFEEAPEE
jgi:hypothetical protein